MISDKFPFKKRPEVPGLVAVCRCGGWVRWLAGPRWLEPGEVRLYDAQPAQVRFRRSARRHGRKVVRRMPAEVQVMRSCDGTCPDARLWASDPQLSRLIDRYERAVRNYRRLADRRDDPRMRAIASMLEEQQREMESIRADGRTGGN